MIDFSTRPRIALIFIGLAAGVGVNAVVVMLGLHLVETWGWPEWVRITVMSIVSLAVIIGWLLLEAQVLGRLFQARDRRRMEQLRARLESLGMIVETGFDDDVATEHVERALPLLGVARHPHLIAYRNAHAHAQGPQRVEVWSVRVPIGGMRVSATRSIIWTVIVDAAGRASGSEGLPALPALSG